MEDLVDLFDLTGKVAVVSGGGRGIGLMMARGLLQAGASVYISWRRAEAGQAAVADLSRYGVVLSVPADLSREEECLRLAEEVGRHAGSSCRSRRSSPGCSDPVPDAGAISAPRRHRDCGDRHGIHGLGL